MGGGRPLDCSVPVRGQVATKDGRRLAVFLRYKDPNPSRGEIKVYCSKIKLVAYIFTILSLPILFSICRKRSVVERVKSLILIVSQIYGYSVILQVK